MTGSGVFYTNVQLGVMQSALKEARQAQNSGDSAGVLSALASYYSVQTPIRGYAQLAIQVLNDTGLGIVANKEVANAVGQSVYTPAFQADPALQLANRDFAIIGDNNHQVPTLADDATIHQDAFFSLGIPITAWGGAPTSRLAKISPTGWPPLPSGPSSRQAFLTR